MTIGVVAATRSPLRGSLVAALAGVGAILHAGDLGDDDVIEALGALAPLVAVGSVRDFLTFGERFAATADVVLGGARIRLAHLRPDHGRSGRRDDREREPPDIWIHGNESSGEAIWEAGTLWLCPGHVEPRTPGRRAGCAILEIGGPGRIASRLLTLAD